ncbi:MAG: polysaccharide deacetylase [Methylocystis sp.]|nr:polysaccharide deacetylase [Methylocystis sp.]MCA3585001.1 polysaccharide deacetylase [Methylocystis sp.]MCA3586931.1 polysaccharide deacetylase [Methylocystis sp.]MCA3592219.1 polysaccharide deacetylase [Methylocystis sp.]
MSRAGPSGAAPADVWQAVTDELTHWRAAGRQARLWLRDDDAVAPTPALDRLLALCRDRDAPVLLAVIPLVAEAALAERLAGEPLVHPAAHGIRHENHAPAGRKAEETPPERGEGPILEALQEARARMTVLFGLEAAGRYVPPWNRLPPGMARWLPAAGFRWISAFGPENPLAGPRLRQVNAHVDLIDWRQGRCGRTEAWTAAALAAALQEARSEDFRPVGILSHHLAHDAQAWRTLEALMAFSGTAGAAWTAPPS